MIRFRHPRPRSAPPFLAALSLPAVLLLAAALLGSCAPRPRAPALVSRSVTIVESPVVGDLSLLGAGGPGELLAVYSDPTNLSLVLAQLHIDPPAARPDSPQANATPVRSTYFERIADSPETGALFGNHVLLTRGERIDLFYHDLQSDGSGLTKWVHRAADEPHWWIDVLPPGGLLVAAVPDGAEGVRLVHQDRQTLNVTASAAPQVSDVLLRPFEAVSRGQPVEGDPEGSFTLYDRLSNRLYLLRVGPAGLQAQALRAGGQVHYARREEDRFVFLVYDRSRASLVLLEEAPVSGTYSARAVTPTEQTSIAYFGRIDGSRFYLFDEYDSSAEEDRRYSLAVLLPDSPRAASGYTKAVLAAWPRPLRAARVLQQGRFLHILCAQDGLRLISVELPGGGS